MPTQPTGQQLNELIDSLLDAFSYDELSQLTRLHLDQNLEQITSVAGKRDLKTITSDLVVYFASQENGLFRLLDAASGANPHNEKLNALSGKWADLEFLPSPLPFDHSSEKYQKTVTNTSILEDVSVEGDFIARDKIVQGDEVHGDKIGGDKVEGDKNVFVQTIRQRPIIALLSIILAGVFSTILLLLMPTWRSNPPAPSPKVTVVNSQSAPTHTPTSSYSSILDSVSAQIPQRSVSVTVQTTNCPGNITNDFQQRANKGNPLPLDSDSPYMSIEVNCIESEDIAGIVVSFPLTSSFPLEYLDEDGMTLAITTSIPYAKEATQAAVAYATGNFTQTEFLLSPILDKLNSVDAYYLYGQTLFRNEKWEEARNAYNQVLTGSDKTPNGSNEIHANSYAAMGLSFIQEMRKVAYEEKGKPSAKYDAARSKCLQHAEAMFDKAIDNDPQRLLWQIGYVHASMECSTATEGGHEEQWQKHKEIMSTTENLITRTASTINKLDIAHANMLRGKVLNTLSEQPEKDRPAARTFLEIAIEHDARLPSTYKELSCILFQLNEEDEAYKNYGWYIARQYIVWQRTSAIERLQDAGSGSLFCI